jgi:hypothetical protein
MVEHYHDHWARRMIAHHSHLKCGQTKVTNLKEPQCVQYLVQGLIKSILSHKDSYQESWPTQTIQMSLRATQTIPAISLE